MSFAARALAAQQERRRKRLFIAHLMVSNPEPHKEPVGLAAAEQTHRRDRKEPAQHGKGQEGQEGGDASPPKPESPSPAAAPPTPCPSQQRALAVLRQRHPTAAHLAAPASRQLGPEDPAPAPNRRWRMPLPVVLQPRPASEPSTAAGTGAAAGASSLPCARPSMNPDYGAGIGEEYEALEAAEAQQGCRPKVSRGSGRQALGAPLEQSGGASAPPSHGHVDPELQRTACAIQAVKAAFSGWGADNELRSPAKLMKSVTTLLVYSDLGPYLRVSAQQLRQRQQLEQLLQRSAWLGSDFERQARSEAAQAAAFFQRHTGVNHAWLRAWRGQVRLVKVLADLDEALHDSGVAEEWTGRGKGDGDSDSGDGDSRGVGSGKEQQEDRVPSAAAVLLRLVPLRYLPVWQRLRDFAEEGDADANLVFCRALCGLVLWHAAAGCRLEEKLGHPLYLAAMSACYQALQVHPAPLNASPCLLLGMLHYGPVPPLHTWEELRASRGLGATSVEPLSLENLQTTVSRVAQHPESAVAWMLLYASMTRSAGGGAGDSTAALDHASLRTYTLLAELDASLTVSTREGRRSIATR